MLELGWGFSVPIHRKGHDVGYMSLVRVAVD
jgi:hypothetical protein